MSSTARRVAVPRGAAGTFQQRLRLLPTAGAHPASRSLEDVHDHVRRQLAGHGREHLEHVIRRLWRAGPRAARPRVSDRVVRIAVVRAVPHVAPVHAARRLGGPLPALRTAAVRPADLGQQLVWRACAVQRHHHVLSRLVKMDGLRRPSNDLVTKLFLHVSPKCSIFERNEGKQPANRPEKFQQKKKRKEKEKKLTSDCAPPRRR